MLNYWVVFVYYKDLSRYIYYIFVECLMLVKKNKYNVKYVLFWDGFKSGVFCIINLKVDKKYKIIVSFFFFLIDNFVDEE